MTARTYASRRKRIVDALVSKLKTINGQGAFLTDVGENVHPTLKFWDEVDEFPALHCNAGSETREYQTAGVRDRFLSITIRCYVQEEDAQEHRHRRVLAAGGAAAVRPGQVAARAQSGGDSRQLPDHPHRRH